jgi:glyoxylase-like metal-dependent hydrolase (beta-lactamase superfamily II)
MIGAVAIGLPDWAAAQPSAVAPQAEELAPGLVLIRGAANCLVYTSADGATLVDAPAPGPEGPAEYHTTARTLFNTNWRDEHTGANDALGRAGVRIIAHENTKLWMGNDFTVPWQNRHYRPRPAHEWPNVTFYTSGRLEVGRETIEYGHLKRAHTDGDIFVFFRRANVLAVSDLLAVDGYPIVDYATGGWIGGMREATRALLALADDDTIIVPAVGAPQSRRAAEAQLELCEVAYQAVGAAFTKALSLAELITEEPLAGFVADRGDPTLFLELAYKGAWNHVRNLGLGIV